MPDRNQLIVIEEILEDSDVSISSENSDSDGLPHRPRRKARDRGMIDKARKENTNPSPPPQGNAGPGSPVLAASNDARNGEPSITILETARPAISNHAQPFVEESRNGNL